MQKLRDVNIKGFIKIVHFMIRYSIIILLVARRRCSAARIKTKTWPKEPKISSTVEASKSFWRPSKLPGV